MTTQHSRPWYISDRACDEYRQVAHDDDGEFRMLKSLKILRSIIVNLGIIAIGLYSISLGGDPTIVGTLALLVIGGYNGLEFSDYLALVRAYNEVQSEGNE